MVGVNGKPGEGFYPYAINLGLFQEGDDEVAFWKNECEKVYHEWKISYRISKTKLAVDCLRIKLTRQEEQWQNLYSR